MRLVIECTYATKDMSIGGKMEDFIDRHRADPDIHEARSTFGIPLENIGDAAVIVFEFRQSLPKEFRPAQCAATVAFDPVTIE